MTGAPLQGLTWDHPRAYGALDQLGRIDAAHDDRYGGVAAPIVWHRQPLSGFESTPVAELARRYDVLVLDHPHLADAVAAEALVPMDEVLDPVELDRLRAGTAGPSYDSYRYDGRQWALPLDVATQVGAVRHDLARVDEVPATWREVVELARRVPVALCLGGPHALLTAFALCAAQGREPCGDDTLATGDALVAALETMAELLALADADVSMSDPIGVLDAMAGGDRVAYCPLVYGYVTYSRRAGRPVEFRDAPAWTPGGRRGSVLGGTGLAVSSRVTDTGAVRAHLRRLVDERVQVDHVPLHGGQPSARAAWTDERVNADSRDFYRGTLRTVEQAWVRPRRRGFVEFCDSASAQVREGLLDGEPAPVIARRIETTYRTIERPR